MSSEERGPARREESLPAPELGLVGHAETRRALRSALARGALPQALILSGPDGIGKQRLARWLVAARWCQAVPAPCGACSSCRKVAGGQHPDLELLERNPPPARDPLDAGSRTEITVDQVRRGLLPALSLRAVEGRGRAAIVDDADTLNEAAQNALLKTLEEPPPDCLLLLLCAHEDALLDTVRSRCQVLRLAPLDDAEMAQLFPDADAAALRLARGRPGRFAELAGLDVAALGALLAGTVSGTVPGTAFARAVQQVIAAHVEHGLDRPGAHAARAAGAPGIAGGAPRDAERTQRLVAELLLAHWRDLLAGPAPPAAEPSGVQEALLEVVADLARNIPPGVTWTAAGLALARAHSAAHVVPAAGSAPHG